MKAVRKTTKLIGRGKSKTQEVPPTHKAVKPKPHEKKTEHNQVDESVRQSRDFLLALSRAAQSVQRARTPDDIYRAVGEQIKALGLDATVFTFDNDGQNLLVSYTTYAAQIIRASEKIVGFSTRDFRLPVSPESIYGRIIAAEKAEYIPWTDDIVAEALPKVLRPLVGQLMRVLKIDQSIMASLHMDGAVLGMLAISGSGLSHEDVPAIETFAAQVAISLLNARLAQQAQEELEERKRVETALRSAEENYRSIFEQAPVGIFQSTPQGRFRNVNPAMAQIYGYDSPKQMITEITSIGDQVYVNSSTRQEFQRILAERGEIHNSLDENYRKDGSHIWTQTTARTVKDKDGNILFYEGFIIDVTERLQEQQQLYESEERFRALIENASEMILTITADGNLNYVSPAAQRITGYQANEAIGRNIVEFIHADDLPLALQALTSRTQTPGLAPTPIELRFRHKDGMWRNVEILGNNLLEYPAVKGIVLNVRDITERKQAEAALRESEDRNRDLVENSQDLICTHDLNGQILSFNPSAEKMLGYPVETLKQMNIRDIIVPSAHPVFETYIAILKRRGKAHGIMHIQTGNGEQRFWEYNNTLRTEGVTTPIVRGMARDITERKRAEDALRENEKTFRSLFENMLNGFAYCKMLFEHERPYDFIYLEVNKAFETLTGLKNVVGKKVSEVIPGIRESDSKLIATYGRVALTGIAETFETYVEALRMWFSISVYSPKKEYFVAVFDVITERKQAEEEIKSQLEELQRWQDVMLGRGDREQKLKREVNELCRRVGESARYPSQEIGAADSETAPTKS